MREYIVRLEDDDKDYEEMFVATIRDCDELIRCKDCINRYSKCPMATLYPAGSITFRAQDDWFCNMGERKEE